VQLVIFIVHKSENDIKRVMNKNEITLAVMVDYSNSFNTIDHTLLFQKLQSLQFGKSFLRIIVSYLSNRMFKLTSIDRVLNQSSLVLGSILFNIYVAELKTIIK